MGTRIALTVVCTILPFFVLLRYYYTRDIFREPRGALVRTFLLGFAITIPAVLAELGLGAVPLQGAGPLARAAYSAFVVAAIPEELLKLLVVRGYCARLPDFDEPMDGIVYGATAALGFAAIENVLFVAAGGLFVAALRSVTSVPMHAMCGALLGYFVAQSVLARRRGAIWWGFLAAVAVHGLYDFAPMAVQELAAVETDASSVGLSMLGFLVMFAAVLVATWLVVRRLILRLRAGQLLAGPPASEDEAPLAARLHARESAATISPRETLESDGPQPRGGED